MYLCLTHEPSEQNRPGAYRIVQVRRRHTCGGDEKAIGSVSMFVTILHNHHKCNLAICPHVIRRRAVRCSLPVPELLRTYSHPFPTRPLHTSWFSYVVAVAVAAVRHDVRLQLPLLLACDASSWNAISHGWQLIWHPTLIPFDPSGSWQATSPPFAPCSGKKLFLPFLLALFVVLLCSVLCLCCCSSNECAVIV